MIDPAEDLVTFKIRENDRDWAEEEQKRIKKSTGDKPTQAQLFSLLRNAYEGADQSAPKPHISPSRQDGPATLGVPRTEWHRMLDQVLDTRVTNPLVINIVTNLLAYGYDAVAISKGHFKTYEVETRVLRELTAELLGSKQAEEITAIAEFMTSASPGDRRIIDEMLNRSKQAQAEFQEKDEQPQKERPRKRAGNER